MTRFLLPILFLVIVAGVPAPANAQQACDISKPFVEGVTCPTGQKCKSVNGAPGKCVADECNPKCGTNETCLLGKCIAKTTRTQDSSNPGPTRDSSNPGGGGLTNPLKSISSLKDLLNAVLGAVVQIGSIILVLALVYVGFLFVVAQGNEEKIRNAKSALLWTVIGGLLLLGAQAIGLVIEATVQTL